MKLALILAIFHTMMMGCGEQRSQPGTEPPGETPGDPGEGAPAAAPGPGAPCQAATMLGPLPYRGKQDSPFQAVKFRSFHLEDVEDGRIDAPGLIAGGGKLASSFGADLIDSVDSDDGALDDSCRTCEAWWAPGSITYEFDATVLGELPTHVGVVWTDGDGEVTVEAHGPCGALGTLGPFSGQGFPDGDYLGKTGEDRFMGVIAPDGVQSITVRNSHGGVETDHIQYGLTGTSPRAGQPHLTSSGTLSMAVGEASGTHASLRTEMGKGFSAEATYRSRSPDSSGVIAWLHTDSNTGVTAQQVVAVGWSSSIGTDARLPRPTAHAVAAYVVAAYAAARPFELIAMPTGDPAAGKNLAREPAIYRAYSLHPRPGNRLHLLGEFVGKDPARVFFQHRKEVKVLDNGHLRESTVVEREVEAEVLDRGKHRLEVRIPNITGDVYIVVRMGTMESVAFEYKLLDAGEEVSWDRVRGERIVFELFDQLHHSETLGELHRVYHVFTQKEGEFRYRIGSWSETVDIDGQKLKMRWIFHLDGHFDDGFKEGTLDIKVSLVPEGREKEFLDAPGHVLTTPVSLLRLRAHQTDDVQIYDAEILHKDLASALGVSWNQDTSTLSLSNLDGFRLDDHGLFLGWDNKAQQIVFRTKSKLGELEIRGGDNSSARFVDREEQIIDGKAHHFALTSRTEGDRVYTVISDEIGVDDKPGSPKRATFELAFDSHADPDASNPNVDARAAVYAYEDGHSGKKMAELTLSAKLRDNKLSELDVNLGVKERFQARFGYDQDSGEVLNRVRQHIWTGELSMKTKFAEADLTLIPYGSITYKDARRSPLDSVTFRAGTRLELDKGLNFNFDLSAAYELGLSGSGSQTWELTGIGSAEVLDMEFQLGATGRWSGTDREIDVFGGVDVEGVGRQVLKLFGEERKHHIEIYSEKRSR